MLDYEHTPYLYYIPTKYHHCTLSSFDFRGQKKIEPILKDFIEGTGDRKGLYLYGLFGVGKSHLLVSLYRIIVAREEDPSMAYYISFEKVMKELYQRLDAKESTSDYIDVLSDVEYLFLDDITAVTLRDYPLEILRKIINERYETDLSTCFASQASLRQLAEWGVAPHAISRVEGMCELVPVIGKDRRRKEVK